MNGGETWHTEKKGKDGRPGKRGHGPGSSTRPILKEGSTGNGDNINARNPGIGKTKS